MTSTPSRSLSLMATLILSAATAACGQDASAPNPAADPSPQQAPLAPTSSPTPAQPPAKTDVGPQASASAPPASSRRKCYLAVDAKVLVDEPCLVFPFGDGGYTLNAWSEGKPKNSHFAVVVLNADGSGAATWNADPDDDKAGDPLGTVRLRDDCWVNDRARICVS